MQMVEVTVYSKPFCRKHVWWCLGRLCEPSMGYRYRCLKEYFLSYYKGSWAGSWRARYTLYILYIHIALSVYLYLYHLYFILSTMWEMIERLELGNRSSEINQSAGMQTRETHLERRLATKCRSKRVCCAQALGVNEVVLASRELQGWLDLGDRLIPGSSAGTMKSGSSKWQALSKKSESQDRSPQPSQWARTQSREMMIIRGSRCLRRQQMSGEFSKDNKQMQGAE